MKKLGLLLGVVALLVPSLVLAGDIKIGLMCPLTGKWASEGQDMKNIVSLLVDETNARGGINGSKVDLVVEDDAGDPRTAALAAQKLASAGVVAVIGTYGSAVTEATQNILAESELVQIGTGSTSVRLTEKGLPLFFRTCPRDDAQGKAAAAAIIKAGYKKVALLHDNSSYAKGLAEESRAALEKAGVKIIFYDALTPGERDYTAILTKLKAASPDLIFFTGYYPETGMLLRQKKEMGWDVPMMGGDAANHQDLVKIAGPEAAAAAGHGYRRGQELPEGLQGTLQDRARFRMGRAGRRRLQGARSRHRQGQRRSRKDRRMAQAAQGSAHAVRQDGL